MATSLRLRISLESQISSPAIERAWTISQVVFPWTTSATRQDKLKTPITDFLARSLPGLGVTLGAVLNVALLYDLFESSQAILTDQFLVRKYPAWYPHFTPSSHTRRVREEE